MEKSILRKFKIKILAIVALTIFSSVIAQQEFYHTSWLINIKESGNDRKFYFGMRNFDSNNDDAYLFTKGHIYQRDPFFIFALRRNQVGIISTMFGNPTPSYTDFHEQHYYYFLDSKLASLNGFFYVLEDAEDQCTTGTTRYEVFCEVRYYVQYYSNYKKARLAYENLLGNTNPTPKVVFGGPNGMIASNDINYFLDRYLTPWCPYKHGIWSYEIQTNQSALKLNRRWHVYVGSHNDTPTPNFYLPTNHNNPSDATDICNFLEPVEGETYIPSELLPNCHIYFNTNPEDVNGSAVSTKTNLACANEYWNMDNTSIPYYYEHLGECKINDRTYIKINDLDYIDKPITVKYSCTSSSPATTFNNSGAAVNFTFRDFWGSNYEATQNLNNSDSVSCTYVASGDPGLQRSDCNSNVTFTCMITEITPSYLDFRINNSSSYNNKSDSATGANPGTITNTLNLRISLNLYDPRP